MKTVSKILVTICLGALAAGCVEHRMVYVPAPQPAPAYTPPPQVAKAPAVPPQAGPQPTAPVEAPLVSQAPPTPQVEVVPVAPGPEYVWAPGYWTIGVHGGWVWAGGHYVVRPRPHAVWVSGGSARHGHGYVWVGGHWR